MRSKLAPWLLALSLALGAALGGHAALARSGANDMYLALGDSYAAGVGASDPATRGYVPRLFPFFKQERNGGADRLRNLAVSGETSGSFIAGGQLERALAAIANPKTNVSVVTVDIGGNDLLAVLRTRTCLSAPAGAACKKAVAAAVAEYGRNYSYILLSLRSALNADPGDERLLTMTYFNVFDGRGAPYEAPADAALLGEDRKQNCRTTGANWGLNDVIRCYAAGVEGARTADAYARFEGETPELLSPDGIHPNDEGHAAIAGAFKRVYE